MSARPAPLPPLPDDAVPSRERGRLLRLRGAARKSPEDAGKREAYETALAAAKARPACKSVSVTPSDDLLALCQHSQT